MQGSDWGLPLLTKELIRGFIGEREDTLRLRYIDNIRKCWL